MFPMRLISAAAVAIVAVWPALASAGLTFSQREIGLSAALTDPQVQASFKFTNTTDHNITITNISTDCGCVAASVAAKIYRPSEAGSVNVTVSLSERDGPQREVILVKTDDGAHSFLTLRIELPRAVELNPTQLAWKQNDTAVPQTVMISLSGKAIAGVKTARIHSDLFSVSWHSLAGNRTIVVTVVPKGTDRLVRTMLEIQTEASTGKYAVLRIPVAVIRPSQTETASDSEHKRAGAATSK